MLWAPRNYTPLQFIKFIENILLNETVQIAFNMAREYVLLKIIAICKEIIKTEE